MKAIVLLFFFAIATHSASVNHFAGAVWSTACPVLVGAQITLDANANDSVVRATIVEDGDVIAELSGFQDSRGRFRLYSLDNTSTLVGRFFVRKGSTVFIGTGKDENCHYRFQGRFRRTIE
jgi:hypothetical protein